MNMKRVAVYWTLKKGFHNHRVMEMAQGKFIREDYIQFKHLWSGGFPRVKFVKEGEWDINKWIKVEIYDVEEQNVHFLDRLEGYTEGSEYNHYNRILIKTLSGEEVSAYEICHDNNNVAENYFKETVDGKNLYEWTY